jgi:hypothetical protein
LLGHVLRQVIAYALVVDPKMLTLGHMYTLHNEFLVYKMFLISNIVNLLVASRIANPLTLYNRNNHYIGKKLEGCTYYNFYGMTLVG